MKAIITGRPLQPNVLWGLTRLRAGWLGCKADVDPLDMKLVCYFFIKRQKERRN